MRFKLLKLYGKNGSFDESTNNGSKVTKKKNNIKINNRTKVQKNDLKLDIKQRDEHAHVLRWEFSKLYVFENFKMSLKFSFYGQIYNILFFVASFYYNDK